MLQSERLGRLRLDLLLPVLAAVLLGLFAGVAVALSPLIAFGAVLGLLGAYGILVSRRFGLLVVFAIMLLLPFGTLPFKAVITPTLLSLAILATLGVLLLRLLAYPEEPLQLTPLGLPLLGFLGLTLFAFLLGSRANPDTQTLHNYAKFILAVFTFFLMANLLRTRSELRWALRFLLLGGGLAALIALLLYLLNDQTALRLLVALSRIGYPAEGRVLRYVEAGSGTGLERAIGTAVDPNAFGGMLALVLAVCATQVITPRPVLPRWLLGGMSLLMFVALFLTYSRAALGGLIVAGMYVATLRYRRLWWAILGAGLLAALVFVGLGLGEAFVGRVVEGIQFQDQANQMRLAEYRNALAVISRYPLFGIGFGAAPDLDLVAGVSSIYLAIAQRTGLVGLTVFLLLIAGYYSLSWNALRELDEERAAWVIGLQAGVAAALAVGLLDHYFFNIEFSHMVALLWSTIGMTLAIPRVETD